MPTTRQAQAIMKALANKLRRLREKREELRESGEFTDQLDAQVLGSKIGKVEEDLAEMEREHPTAAQNVDV